MYFKHNNTYLSNSLNDMPLNEMKLGDQMIIFENKEDEKTGGKIDNHKDMILSNFGSNTLRTFTFVDVMPNIGYKEIISENEEEEITYELEYADFERVKEKSLIFIVLPSGEKFNLGEDDINQRTYHEYDLDMYNKYGFNNNIENIYNSIFHSTYGGTYALAYAEFHEAFTQLNKEYISTFHLSIPVNGDIFLFSIIFKYNMDNMSWFVSKTINILCKDDKIIKIDYDNFKEFYDFVINSKASSLFLNEKKITKFNEIISLSDYSVKKYLQDDSGFKNSTLFKLINLLESNSGYRVQEKLLRRQYEPVYENKDLNFKMYINNEHICYDNVLFTINDKFVSSYWLKMKEQNDLLNEIRIGENIVRFIHDYKKGMNPYTGEYILRPDENIIINFEDAAGKILRVNNYEYIYTLNKGYWVIANKDEVKEIFERKMLINKLSENKQKLTEDVNI